MLCPFCQNEIHLEDVDESIHKDEFIFEQRIYSCKECSIYLEIETNYKLDYASVVDVSRL